VTVVLQAIIIDRLIFLHYGSVMTYKLPTMLAVLLLLTGCSTTNVSNSAWSTYDYRFPVPAGTGLPDSGYSGGYQDNDDNYTQPAGYGCMGDTGQVC
jgi:hypothetical protein